MAGRPAVVECIGPSYPLPDRKSSTLRSVNWFVRQIEGLGEGKKLVLDSVPGLVELLDLGATIRGSYTTEDRWFVVAGSTLYELTTLSAVSRGSLGTSTGPVSMVHGRDQLILVDGPNGYALTLGTNVFTGITDSDFRGSDWVAQLNGTFVFVAPDTDQFYISEIDEGTDFDALNFSSADSQPDNIVTHRVIKQELFLFGVDSTEVWIYTGDSDFPLVRYNSTPINVGIVGVSAACEAADTLFFVGRTKGGHGVVYRLDGHQPRPVSDRAVETALQGSTDLSLCSMWSFQSDGAEFIGINAPGMETTWVYNPRTQLWHEQGEYVSASWTPFPIEYTAFFGGRHYALSGETVSRLSVESNDGASAVRERTWPHLVSPGMEPILYRSLELACSTGHGGDITLEVSNDGGHIFGPPLRRSLGATGRTMERIRWFFLGSSRDRVFRLRCTDSVPLVLHNAALDAE